ncbi:glycosyltransferase family 2 protein [bacterium]|nr:glycosyltransferase family 2 protein [bacterium]
MGKEYSTDVSIIIVNWNTRELLRKCLESIYAEMQHRSFEIIVIDNASADQSVEMVKADFPGVRLIENRENVGFGKANNQGYEISTGEYLLLLNPDTEILDQAVERLMEFMDTQRQAGLCGAKCIHPDGTIQVSWAYFPSLKTIFTNNVSWKDALSIFSVAKRLLRTKAEYSDSGFTVSEVIPRSRVDYVLGQCMLTRKEIVDRVGLFDESVFMYEEEPDLCYRILQAGYETWFVPEAEIIHHERKSIGQVNDPLKTDLKWFVSARSHFFQKHHGRWYKWAFRVLGSLNAVVKMVIFALLFVVTRTRKQYYRSKLLFHYYFIYWAVRK